MNSSRPQSHPGSHSHADPSRPLPEAEAASSAKRPSRPAPDPKARAQRMEYERDLLRRNRHVEEQLDHALVESFPASDPLAVTPEGVFPVRDPKLAEEPPADEPSTDEPSTDEPSTDEPQTDEPPTDERPEQGSGPPRGTDSMA